MKRIRLEVPDEWPGQFKLYGKALELLANRPSLVPRDVLPTFKLMAGLPMNPWQVPSFRAWAAIRGWSDAQQIVDDLAAVRTAPFEDDLEELNQAAADKAAADESEL